LIRTAEKPVTYAYRMPENVPQTTRKSDPRAVEIRDARPIADGLSLDSQGFVLAEHSTKVDNFYDDQQVRDIYYPEVEQLLREKTGGVRVVIFDHVVRNAAMAGGGRTTRANTQRPFTTITR